MVEVRQIAFSKIMSRFFVFFEVFRLAFLFVFDFWVCCFYLGWILGLLSFDLWLLWVSVREWERLAIPTIAENFKIEKIEARFFFCNCFDLTYADPKTGHQISHLAALRIVYGTGPPSRKKARS